MFTKGDPRINYAGRPKGVPSKKKLKPTAEILAALNFNPAIKLLELYYKTGDNQLKARILQDLMTYVEPKRKERELAQTPEDSVANAQEALELIKALENNGTNETKKAE